MRRCVCDPGVKCECVVRWTSHIENPGIEESGLFLDATDQIGRSARHEIVVHEHKIDICVSTMAECGRLSSHRGFGSRRCCRCSDAGHDRCLVGGAN